MTTKEEIRRWLVEGLDEKATHVVIVCDTFDHSDYPVYVSSAEDVRTVFDRYDGPNMQRVMEVYALHLPIEPQLAETRAFHFEVQT